MADELGHSGEVDSVDTLLCDNGAVIEQDMHHESQCTRATRAAFLAVVLGLLLTAAAITTSTAAAASSVQARVPSLDLVSQMQTQAPPPPPANVQPGFGQCGPMEQNVRYQTEHDYSVAGVQDMQACCARCQATPSCFSWLWIPNNGVGGAIPGECNLKGGMFRGRFSVMRSSMMPGFFNLPYELISGNATGRVPQGINPNQFRYQAVHSDPGAASPACPQPGFQIQIANPSPPVGKTLKVLTFNLQWWANFDKGFPDEMHAFLRTKGNPATALLAQHPGSDMMAFQECGDVQWILQKAGLGNEYEARQGPEGVGIAWRKTEWQFLGDGWAYVSEDKMDNYWGRRGVQWIRAQHIQSKKNLLFLNHHGPLQISTGGTCGPEGTALNLLNAVQQNAQAGDAIVLVGDFNADGNSQTVQLVSGHLTKAMTGTAFGGVDNIFSNLGAATKTLNLGAGGSDHQALEVQFQM